MNREPRRRRIAVFGSGQSEPDSEDYAGARALGQLVAERGWDLVTGGYGGVMEAACRGARDRNGCALGILVESLGVEGNAYLTQRRVAPDLLSRLKTLIEIADAYIVFPGSTGTLAELALVWEMLNKNMIPDRPLLCLGRYWNPVVEHLADQPTHDSRIANQRGPKRAGDRVHFFDQADEALEWLDRTWR